MKEAVTLDVLARRLAAAVSTTPGLADVWVSAEISELRTAGGHCYLELVHKDAKGTPLAKMRAVIWASAYQRLSAKFYSATGTRLAADIKVMAQVTANYHPVYGFSLVISDIDPEYSEGDLARKRFMIIERLRCEGVFDMNRTLPWPEVPWRIAVVSAQGAAGYGDFVKHLYSNPLRLRFTHTLFPAVMQGENAPASVIAALGRIADCMDRFDAVVIIRGGGAVSELACFDDYELAEHVAQFPLPVVVGIGHERDVTVLDYIASVRVKTPTAAAEHFIGLCVDAYGRIAALGEAISHAATMAVAGSHRQLEYIRGSMPALVNNVLSRNRAKVDERAGMELRHLAEGIVARRRERLAAMDELLAAISPEATLARGYTITRVGGRAVTDSATLIPGTVITTSYARGPETKSTVS